MRTPRSHGLSLGIAALAAALALPFAAHATDAGDGAEPLGLWLDESGRGAIEITSCGAGLCGRLVWVQGDSKDARAACGLQIIGDVKKIDATTWNGGWIYSPELKSRFDVEIKPLDGDSLQVTGFAGSRDLSETFVWRRAPAGIGRCDVTPRAGYVAAKVAPKEGVASAAVAARDGGNARASAAAAKASSRRAAKVASHGGDGQRHTATCHVPFASFRCTAKTSRVLARIF